MQNADSLSSFPSRLEDALAQYMAGLIDEAVRLYRALLADDPQQPDALHMLGVIAHQRANPELALKLTEAALASRPSMVSAWYNRSLILRTLGRNEEALQSAKEAVALDPNAAEAWNMAGFLLREMKDFEGARVHQERALQLKPDDTTIQNDYALLLQTTGSLRDAYRIFQRLEKAKPDFVPMPLANLLKAAGYPERAIPLYYKMAELAPGLSDVRNSEAMARLQIGDFDLGWPLWETRPTLDPFFANVPVWKGDHIEHLLLFEDQGLGDALQGLRYLPFVRPLADKISFHVRPHLQKLLRAHFSDLEILTLEDPLPPATAGMRLISLPALFGTRLETIPKNVPYLHAEDSWRLPWREGLKAMSSPRIGLVWGGNPEHRNDYNRSIAFSLLTPLIEGGRGHLVSLQKGAQKANADLLRAGIFDADPWIEDFSDTAGLLSELDLLISVDTSVVHLAGAMGRPVWLLLPFDSDWRWLLGREDSPWYPEMRLFRQEEPGLWGPVLARVSEELRQFISGDARVLKPVPWKGKVLRQHPYALPLE